MDNQKTKPSLKDESNKQKIDKKVEDEKEVKKETRNAINIKPKEENIKREVVIHYRKPSVFSCILLILIGGLIATIIFLVIYFFKINNYDVKIYSDLIDSNIEMLVEENGGE